MQKWRNWVRPFSILITKVETILSPASLWKIRKITLSIKYIIPLHSFIISFYSLINSILNSALILITEHTVYVFPQKIYFFFNFKVMIGWLDKRAIPRWNEKKNAYTGFYFIPSFLLFIHCSFFLSWHVLVFNNLCLKLHHL